MSEVTTPPPADAGQPQPADPTLGGAIDEKIENLRAELNARIDEVQARIDEMQSRVDGAQGQTPAPIETTVPPVPGQQQAQG